MSSYYKKIDGKNYDRAMIDIADGSVAGKGDGRISLADSRHIVKQIKDGGKITDIENRTLKYILENYKLTETALKHIEKNLSDNMTDDTVKSEKEDKKPVKQQTVSEIKQAETSGGKWKKIFIFLIILFLIVFAVFAVIKYFYKNVNNDNLTSEKKDQISSTSVNEKGLVNVPDTGKIEPLQVKPLTSNQYLIKENDTLIKISEALYGDYKKWEEIYKLNKKIIPNPTILFPGQILNLPEKSSDK